MNVCVPMPDGSLHALTDHEADVMRGYLCDRLTHVEERDQGAIRRLLDHLQLTVTPEAQFESERYRPAGYVPGWVLSL